MDFSFITARVATGAAITSQDDVDSLVAAGISHVVDCRGEFDDTPVLASHPSISYLWNGVNDDGAPKPADWFAKTLDFGLPALAQPHSKLYLHCAAGINRGPSSAYALIRASLGLTAAVVLEMVHLARPVTLQGVRYAPDADKALVELGYLQE